MRVRNFNKIYNSFGELEYIPRRSIVEPRGIQLGPIKPLPLVSNFEQLGGFECSSVAGNIVGAVLFAAYHGQSASRSIATRIKIAAPRGQREPAPDPIEGNL